METIMNYIESMFAGVPVNEQTKRLREDITANMSDKYDELVKDGKSVNEAIGTVISEFGNIDEVLTEMGISRAERERKASSPVWRFVKSNIWGLIARPLAPVFLMTMFLWILNNWYNDFRYGADRTAWALLIVSFAMYAVYLLVLHQNKEKGVAALTDGDLEILKAHREINKKITDIVGIAGAIIMVFLLVFIAFGSNMWELVSTNLFACIIILFMGFMIFMRNYRYFLDIYMGTNPDKAMAFLCTVRFCLYLLTISVLNNISHLMMFDGMDIRWDRFLFKFLPQTLLMCLVAIFSSHVVDGFIEFRRKK